jgi:hypothetical protein
MSINNTVELAAIFPSLLFLDAVRFFQNDPTSEYAPERISQEYSTCYFEVSSEGEARNLETDLDIALQNAGFDNYRFESAMFFIVLHIFFSL